MKKLTFEISKEEYQLIKSLAKVKKTTMSQIAAEAVEMRLQQPLFR